MEKCLWEFIIGQGATSVSYFIGHDVVLWPQKKLGSLPVVCPWKGSEFSWKINFVHVEVKY